MNGYKSSLILLLAVFSGGQLMAEVYYINPENVITGDVHIKKGEKVVKGMLIKTGNLLIEGTFFGNCVVEGGSVTVKGNVYEGGIISYGGPVNISGYVSKISSYKGQVSISGRVAHINAVEAEVILDSAAVVEGGINITLSRVITKPGAKIRPEQIQERRPPATYFPSYSIHKTTPNTETVPGFAAGIGLLLLMPMFFMRRNVEGASIMLHESFWKSAGTGIAVCVTIALINHLGLRYSIFLPFALPAFSVGLVALVIGCSAFCRMLGDKVYSWLGKVRPESMIAIVVGYIAMFAIGAAISILGSVGGVMGKFEYCTINSVLGNIAVITAMLLIIAGILGTGALAKIISSPFKCGIDASQ